MLLKLTDENGEEDDEKEIGKLHMVAISDFYFVTLHYQAMPILPPGFIIILFSSKGFLAHA